MYLSCYFQGIAILELSNFFFFLYIFHYPFVILTELYDCSVQYWNYSNMIVKANKLFSHATSTILVGI